MTISVEHIVSDKIINYKLPYIVLVRVGERVINSIDGTY